HEEVVIDAKGKVLGRLATEISAYLQGKHKVKYVANIESGSTVIVINAQEIITTGRKDEQKTYTRYSGFHGGLRTMKLGAMMEKNPEQVVRIAVAGMLPDNKLKDVRLARLSVYNDAHYKATK
ncbi:MAG: 50S ribosomal protein L13, partial [Patescibacteria group bacterium]